MHIFIGSILVLGVLVAITDATWHWIKTHPKDYQYLQYIARHKYFVLKAGRLTKAPLWRLLLHDWSKLMPGTEFQAYREHFYGKPEYQTEYKVAWLRHIHRNPHHWEYWCKFKYENGGAHVTLTPVRDA